MLSVKKPFCPIKPVAIKKCPLKSYLFLPEGEVFGENDCYFIVVKRKDDGVVMRTCEICPGVTTAIDDVFLSDGHTRVGEANSLPFVLNGYVFSGG